MGCHPVLAPMVCFDELRAAPLPGGCAEEAKHNGGQIETCQEEHACYERKGADDRAACGSNIDDVLASQPQEAATASAQTWEDVLGVRRDWKSWVESRLEQPIGNAWAPGTFKKP